MKDLTAQVRLGKIMPDMQVSGPMVVSIVLCALLSACNVDSSDGIGSVGPTQSSNVIPAASPPPTASPSSSSPAAAAEEKPSAEQASRFLMSASFGPNANSIDDVVNLGYSGWIKEQLKIPARPIVDELLPDLVANSDLPEEGDAVVAQFYENAILGADQLRMRATYSLSQLFVVSTASGSVRSNGEGFARYVDILQEGAFGNFRDVLEDVTYSPVMGRYLTYAGNRKANPKKGSAPDENFAREIMQLFTIGLYELNPDGTLKLNDSGRPIETYTNQDITELAKVFTGLWYEGLPFALQRNRRTQTNQLSRMVMFGEEHSEGAKTFLGETLSADLSGDEAISAALDVLFEHPNTAPFISSQLIQRMTTSNPSPEYVFRVAQAFDRGEYTLSDGDKIGSGIRGDMRAVWAAILMDEEYHANSSLADPLFGKVREPVLLFTHWARMSEAPAVNITNGLTVVDPFVLNQHNSSRLGQRPFASPSVFNFYRPGYVAAGSQTARAGLVAPELQITTETSVAGYANFMRTLIFRDEGAGGSNGKYGLVGSYTDEIAIADDAEALVDRLDLLLLAGGMTAETRNRLIMAIESVDVSQSDSEKRRRDRVQLAVLALIVSPEFTVQQ